MRIVLLALTLAACGDDAPDLTPSATVRSCDGLLPTDDVAATQGLDRSAALPNPAEWTEIGWVCSRTWHASPGGDRIGGLELLEVASEADAPGALRWLLRRPDTYHAVSVERSAVDLGDGAELTVVRRAGPSGRGATTEAWLGFTAGRHAALVSSGVLPSDAPDDAAASAEALARLTLERLTEPPAAALEDAPDPADRRACAELFPPARVAELCGAPLAWSGRDAEPWCSVGLGEGDAIASIELGVLTHASAGLARTFLFTETAQQGAITPLGAVDDAWRSVFVTADVDGNVSTVQRARAVRGPWLLHYDETHTARSTLAPVCSEQALTQLFAEAVDRLR